LELRKRLLIAESELNRAQAVQECQAVTEGARSFLGRVKSVGSIASAAALLAAGVTAFRRAHAAHKAEKGSWLHLILKGAQAAAPIWLAWRSRRNERARDFSEY
jgi:NADPH:quinone reductase-like Zn-dependent oxidoreductase